VKKAAVLVPTLALLMISAAVAPVMAIGPWQAKDVGKNPNLVTLLGALKNDRGKAVGVVEWFGAQDVLMKMSFFDTVSGQGKANNAINATISTVAQFFTDFLAYMNGEPTVNENKWIILSPEGSGNQFGGHGMIWWLFNYTFGNSATADLVASLYPNGVYWIYNFVKITTP
jgi:hypothetical protein